MKTCGVICCLPFIYLLLKWMYAAIYHAFTQSAAYKWREQTLSRHAEISAAIKYLKDSTPDTVNERIQEFITGAKRHDTLRQEYFRKVLRKRSVDLLESIQGIGPGTIETLKKAGLTTFEYLEGYNFGQLPGIGYSKSQLLSTGANQIIESCRVEFDQLRCPEGVEYQRVKAFVDAANKERRSKQLLVLENALAKDQHRLLIASNITLLNYKFEFMTCLTAEILNQKLPTCDELLQSVPLVALPDVPVVSTTQHPTAELPVKSQEEPKTSNQAAQPSLSKTADWPSSLVKVTAKAQSVAKVPPTSLNVDLLATRSSDVPSAPQPAAEVPPSLAELKAFAALGILIARADGKIAASERAEVRRFLASQYEHDPRLVRQIDPAIEQAEKARAASDLVFMGLLKVCTDQAKRTLAYNFAVQVADASSGRSAKELALLKRLEETFKLAAPKSEAPKAEAPVADVPAPVNRKPEPVSPALPETPTPAKPAIPTQVPAKPDEPLNIRDNALLDDVFQDQPAPSPVPPVPPPVSGSADLRQNDLLDDVFGG